MVQHACVAALIGCVVATLCVSPAAAQISKDQYLRYVQLQHPTIVCEPGHVDRRDCQTDETVGYPASPSPAAGIIAHADTGNVSVVGPAYNDGWNRVGDTMGYERYDLAEVSWARRSWIS
jgi:hypothetical protein